MYFCPQCNYTFDITKSTLNKEDIKSVDELFEKLKSIEITDLSNYNITFAKDNLAKNKNFKKLSKDKKEIINNLFEDVQFDKIEFQCLNCNFRKPINKSIKLYEYNLENNKQSTYNSITENKLLFRNPIFPRTKDYTCKNLNCITHKDTTKKAVYYKDKQGQLIYIVVYALVIGNNI